MYTTYTTNAAYSFTDYTRNVVRPVTHRVELQTRSANDGEVKRSSHDPITTWAKRCEARNGFGS